MLRAATATGSVVSTQCRVPDLANQIPVNAFKFHWAQRIWKGWKQYVSDSMLIPNSKQSGITIYKN